MIVIPCELCGYDSPARPCPHCGGSARDRGLSADRGRGYALRAGLSALWRGLGLLGTTRGTKRWLVPPFVLTTLGFGFAWAWVYRTFGRWVEAAGEGARQALDADASWWERAVAFVLQSSAFTLLAHLTGLLLWALLGFFVAMYAFSLIYEAISSPFLDEVHGRIETRWFGIDPRNAIERPNELTAGRCAAWSALCACVSIALAWLAWSLDGWAFAWALLAALVAPFVALGLARRDYGRWLAWMVRVESSTLWTSLRTSLVALFLLILCLPLKFVPFVGPILFGAAAGFSTAISLMDIPFSRRRWSLSQRLTFLLQNPVALIAFGSTASLLFLLPFIGPILMVPAASVGGLWLVVRLDKSRLRVSASRRAGASR